MTSPLRASVVINNHNYGRFLRPAIESALAQTYPHVEVVVVDDGSTDDSRAILASFGDRVIAVLKPQGGQASAFNAGFARSRGDIVVFLDADDVLFESAIERIVAAWTPDLAKLHYRLRLMDEHGTLLPGCIPERHRPLESGDLKQRVLDGETYLYPPTTGNAFGRATLDAILPMPERGFVIAADGYLLLLAPVLGRLGAIDEPLGAYRLHDSNRWHSHHVEAERLQSTLTRDDACHELVTTWLQRRGLVSDRPRPAESCWSLMNRLASLRLAPATHPFPTDGRVMLVRRALVATARARDIRWMRKSALLAWFLCVGFTPRSFVSRPIDWALSFRMRRSTFALLMSLFH